jgi:hypothetical protein
VLHIPLCSESVVPALLQCVRWAGDARNTAEEFFTQASGCCGVAAVCAACEEPSSTVHMAVSKLLSSFCLCVAGTHCARCSESCTGQCLPQVVASAATSWSTTGSTRQLVGDAWSTVEEFEASESAVVWYGMLCAERPAARCCVWYTCGSLDGPNCRSCAWLLLAYCRTMCCWLTQCWALCAAGSRSAGRTEYGSACHTWWHQLACHGVL